MERLIYKSKAYGDVICDDQKMYDIFQAYEVLPEPEKFFSEEQILCLQKTMAIRSWFATPEKYYAIREAMKPVVTKMIFEKGVE